MANSSLTKLKKLRADAQALLSEETVVYDEHAISRGRKFAYFLARVHRSFSRNRGPVRAAALSYTTVLALVPMLAIVVSVTTGLLKTEKGDEPIRKLVTYVTENVAAPLGAKPNPDQAEASIDRERAVNEIMTSIQKVNSSTLGVTGVLVFVFVAISLLSTIEAAFNDMWGIALGRSWSKRVVSYWAALTLGPVFLFTALGLTTATQFQEVKSWLVQFELLGKFLFAFLLPATVLGITFSALYLLMPNTKVDWRAAVVGGAVAGILFQINTLLSVLYTSRVVTYHKVYGSLSMVPLFLLGLYIAWLIVLFGGQVAYAYQNRKAYSQEKQAENTNQRGREFIAFRLMTAIGQKFRAGEAPWKATDLADEIGVPLKLICQILAALTNAGLVVEVAGKDIAYVPGRPLNQITAEAILRALRIGQGQEWPTCEGPGRAVVRAAYDDIEQAEKEVADAVTLEELVARVSRPEPVG
jgi:membrane protein